MVSEIVRRVFYNLRYFGHPPWDTGVSPPELLEFIQKSPPGKALDLGSGTGTNLITLAQSGWDVEGIEYAFIAVRTARQKMKKLGYSFKIYNQDVTNLNQLNPPYDLVLDIGCFHGLSTKRKLIYMNNLKKLLSENGAFFIYAFYSHREGEVGITEGEIEKLRKTFNLVTRQMGKDRGGQPSIWLEFRQLKMQ